MGTRRVTPSRELLTKRPTGPNGRRLCRMCDTECPPWRRRYCSQECSEAYLVRTSPSDARDLVFRRDKGVCARCGLDTQALLKKMKGKETRLALGYDGQRDAIRALGFDPDRVSFWDMDHCIPVIEGGGECGLEGLRTLCIPCHKEVTKDLAARRAAQRRGQPSLFEVSNGDL